MYRLAPVASLRLPPDAPAPTLVVPVSLAACSSIAGRVLNTADCAFQTISMVLIKSAAVMAGCQGLSHGD